MPTTVTSPMRRGRRGLAAILDAEFTDLASSRNDNLHESLGYAGTVVRVAPGTQRPREPTPS